MRYFVVVFLLALICVSLLPGCIAQEGVDRIKQIEIGFIDHAKVSAEKIRLLEEEIIVIGEKIKSGELTVEEGLAAAKKIQDTISRISTKTVELGEKAAAEIEAIKKEYNVNGWGITGAAILAVIEILTGLKLAKAGKFGGALVKGIQILKTDKKIDKNYVNSLMQAAATAAGLSRKSFDYMVADAKEKDAKKVPKKKVS